jgi:hypothetical protein
MNFLISELHYPVDNCSRSSPDTGSKNRNLAKDLNIFLDSIQKYLRQRLARQSSLQPIHPSSGLQDQGEARFVILKGLTIWDSAKVSINA